MGAVELGQEKHYVCGPPLDVATFPDRCEYTKIAERLGNSLPGDVLVISGVVTEKVALDKNITIRGPIPTEATPCTQMGVLQAPASRRDGSWAVSSRSVNGISVTIGWLNIRYGDAAQGGGILTTAS